MSIIDYVLKISSTFDSKGFKNLTSNLSATQQNLMKIGMMTAPLFAKITHHALQFGSALLESSKKIGAYESRFFAITKSEKLANEELQWTFDLARKTATNIDTLTDAYSIFYATARQSLGQENTRLIMKDWAEIARVTHLSGDAFGRVMYAMRELSSKGAIYADDVKRQLGSAVPNAIEHARKAAEDLGITGSDWWDKLQSKAKNNQKVVNQFMISFTKYAHQALASPEALNKSLQQTDATLQGLSNTWELFKIRLIQSNAFKSTIRILQRCVIALDWITQHTEIIKQIIAVLATTYIVMLSFQVLSFFLMLKAQLAEVNIMLAGIPILIGLLVMGLVEIALHWKQIKKWFKEGSFLAKSLLFVLKLLLSPFLLTYETIKLIIESIIYWKEKWDSLSDDTKKSIGDITSRIAHMMLPILFLIDLIGRIVEGWGLWKFKIIDAFDTLKEKIKSIVDSDKFKLLMKVIGKLMPSAFGISSLPIANSSNTTINKNENTSKLEIFVNGKETAVTSETIAEGIRSNLPLISKTILGMLGVPA